MGANLGYDGPAFAANRGYDHEQSWLGFAVHDIIMNWLRVMFYDLGRFLVDNRGDHKLASLWLSQKYDSTQILG